MGWKGRSDQSNQERRKMKEVRNRESDVRFEVPLSPELLHFQKKKKKSSGDKCSHTKKKKKRGSLSFSLLWIHLHLKATQLNSAPLRKSTSEYRINSL